MGESFKERQVKCLQLMQDNGERLLKWHQRHQELGYDGSVVAVLTTQEGSIASGFGELLIPDDAELRGGGVLTGLVMRYDAEVLLEKEGANTAMKALQSMGVEEFTLIVCAYELVLVSSMDVQAREQGDAE